jgi:dCMP deaminase
MLEDYSNRDERRKFVIHAEQNSLRFIKPMECYLAATTLLPCNNCLKSLSSYGIKKVIYEKVYDKDSSSLDLAEKFGIELIQVDCPIKID